MIASIFLILVSEHLKVLLDILVLALNFAIALGVIGSSQASLNSKTLVEGAHKSSSKLWTMIGEDLL